MNTLSWLIYAAEVSDRASGVCAFLAVAWVLLCVFVIPLSFIAAYDDNYGRGALFSKWVPWTVTPGVILVELALIAAAVALPSKATIYMIAASEAGETIVTSPDAIEMMGDLKAIIKKRLKDELGSD